MIRKIKDLLGTSTLLEGMSELKRMTQENYWANVFRSSTNGSAWINNESLNVGRWAASYSLLYILFRVLNDVKPVNVLELGLGETTKMIQAYKKGHNPGAYCVTIEHDKSWIDLKKQNGISDEHINIINLELVEQNIHNSVSVMYKGLAESLKETGKAFNLLMIDGPFGSDQYSRYNIIEIVNEKLLDKDFIIIMDDFNRKGEKNTYMDLKKALQENNHNFSSGRYVGAREQIIICSEKYRFLTSI